MKKGVSGGLGPEKARLQDAINTSISEKVKYECKQGTQSRKDGVGGREKGE